MTKEQKFYNALRDLFVGAKIEGKGGFVNLMRVKSSYYSKIREHLEEDINKALEKYPKFREELFDKLYSFFSRYFTRSGSIYFNQTPFYHNIYEKVYTDEKDVILFWKTHMLYYVKSDRIFNNLEVELEEGGKNYKFFFDVSKLEHKRANEKRRLVFRFKKIRPDNTIVFDVFYSERGTKTKVDEIKKELKKKGVKVTDEILERAFRTFEKQSEVDYFINKNAKDFLREQFKLWLHNYIFEEEGEFPKERVDQLNILKDIAYKIIDFIAQFEDELVKIWNKPKFVRKSNYVITLDRIFKQKGGLKIIEKIQKHKGWKEQVKEWKELGILEKEPKDLFENTLTGKQLKKEYQFLPTDTKYFKDLELEILGLFDDLDNSLDGWLIKSENWQALNTILPKFREKVQTIYIDPPFNTGEDFLYIDKFQDSTWLTLIENRLELAKKLLKDNGNIFLHLDRNANYYGRILLNKIFGEDNLMAEISWNTTGITGFNPGEKTWVKNQDIILHYAVDKNQVFFKRLYTLVNPKDRNKPYEERKAKNIGWLDLLRDEKDFFVEKWENGKFVKKSLRIDNKAIPIGMIWSDIYSFLFTQVANNESFFFETQKPEHLIRRIIQATTNNRDLVLDFFSGLGTTLAVAHKLNRKWLGIEMGTHFYTFYEDNSERKIGLLGRMKIVGIVAASLAEGDFRFAFLAGYAGSDFLESLYKIKLKQKFAKKEERESEFGETLGSRSVTN